MNFQDQPGLLFVAATFLPLLSFALLLLAAAVRWALRPYAHGDSVARSIHQLLGGDVTGRGPAYVATFFIAAAFVCCAVGFGLYLGEHHANEEKVEELHKEIHELEESRFAKKTDKEREDLKADIASKKVAIDYLEHRWEGSIPWAKISLKTGSDTAHASTMKLGFRIDMLSAIMFVMVTFVATLIHLFSTGYMKEELQAVVEDHEVHTDHGHYHRRGRFGRFFMFLSLFCFSMLNLLLADNLFQVFVSWELVGVCSFLLIGFYFERTSASNAANKAFITNRIGDAGFIIGLLILWTHLGTFNFQEIYQRLRCPAEDAHGKLDDKDRYIRADLGDATGTGHRLKIAKDGKTGSQVVIFPRASSHLHAPEDGMLAFAQPTARQYGFMPYWMLVVAGLGIFLGCVGKSAQFPLSVWLPDAMEGPTPVSALIHAATMVAAGVYLVGRSYFLFTPEVLLTIAYTGAITLFVAATIAVVVTDIKKVLAYSTVSQLGYMMLALGVGGWAAGLFHLLTHAFFKALLFLCSGSVIYGCHHQQDMLKMGGLFPKMRITAICMLIGVLAIAGIPLFSGWYSKDAVLVSALSFVEVHKEHYLLFLLPLVTAGITTFYMFRMWFMTFVGQPRDHHVHEHAHESPPLMTIPLILLAILSVVAGWSTQPWNAEASWLEHQLHHSQPASVVADFGTIVLPETTHHLHHTAGNLALGIVALGLAFALVLYCFNVLDPAEAKEQFPGVHRFLMNKWYFDEVYSALLVRPSLTIAFWCRNFDTKVVDGLVNLVAKWNLVVSRLSGRFDKGIIDGLVNLVADVWYSIGTSLRSVQTGYLRSYVLFLVLAAVGIWLTLSFLLGGGPVSGAPH
jgi:NADH-quinone oxidoreductase subunit L